MPRRKTKAAVPITIPVAAKTIRVFQDPNFVAAYREFLSYYDYMPQYKENIIVAFQALDTSKVPFKFDTLTDILKFQTEVFDPMLEDANEPKLPENASSEALAEYNRLKEIVFR